MPNPPATCNLHAAKTQPSELGARLKADQEIVIARANRPVVKLVALEPASRPRTRARNLGGITWVADDFDAPVSLGRITGDSPTSAQQAAILRLARPSGRRLARSHLPCVLAAARGEVAPGCPYPAVVG